MRNQFLLHIYVYFTLLHALVFRACFSGLIIIEFVLHISCLYFMSKMLYSNFQFHRFRTFRLYNYHISRLYLDYKWSLIVTQTNDYYLLSVGYRNTSNQYLKLLSTARFYFNASKQRFKITEEYLKNYWQPTKVVGLFKERR